MSDIQDYYNPDDEYAPEPAAETKEGIIPLGHDRGIFYYLSRSAGQVTALPVAQHTRNALTALASVAHYWQRSRFSNEKGAIRWDDAIDWMMDSCRQVGIFDPERNRGRGAWIDDGRAVMHLGDRLILEGEETPLSALRSKFIYEQARILPIDLSIHPMSPQRASKLMGLCMAAPWEDRDGMGRLLAGWCVIAPVCGAMPWRPHLWITSEAGGGKSWVLENIIRPLLGSLALQVQSKTTEAGLRGELGLDARPVVFDEFESQNDADRARVQQVLDLARQASSENGADILKGTQTGGVKRYRIRSCFAFSSINLGMSQAADESRTVVITLRPSDDPAERTDEFAKLQSLHADVMTPDFAGGLLARTMRLLPTIRANADVFASAIARTGASRRTGDTIGVLLAGAWSLRSGRLATAAQAQEFVSGGAWVQQAVARNEGAPEWQRALAHLVQQPMRLNGSNRGYEDIPVSELIQVAAGIFTVDTVTGQRDAATALIRGGIKLQADPDGSLSVLIANTSDTVGSWFSRTPWASGWLATLARAPGASRANKTVAFGALRAKALRLPVSVLLGEDKDAAD